MLRPGLTVEEAESELIDVQNHIFWEFDQDHVFVKAEREGCELLSRSFANGDCAWNFDFSFGRSLEFLDEDLGKELKTRLRKFSKIVGEFYYGGMRIDLDLMSKMEAYLKLAWDDERGAMLPKGFIREWMCNAIEHGSDWCEVGNVTMEVKMAVNGLFAVIEQPKPGLDFVGVVDELAGGKHASKFRYKGDFRDRGAGIHQAVKEANPWIWGEDFEEDGNGMKSRVIILDTRERLLSL